jgi:hypothetical protein
MNTKIARRLNEAHKSAKPGKELDRVSEEITLGHNIAVTNGFLELPTLDWVGADTTEKTISVIVAPKSGMIALNDIYNLKTAWGADDVNVLTADNSIELVFKK